MTKIIQTGIILLFVSGCSSIQTADNCLLNADQLTILQNNARNFLVEKLQNAECEEISDHISYIKHYGCGIYGGPSMKLGCPTVFDGDYWVIFSPKNLSPNELVFIGY